MLKPNKFDGLGVCVCVYLLIFTLFFLIFWKITGSSETQAQNQEF